MKRKKKEYGNCPYCSSSNCILGMSDFFNKNTKKKLNNPLEHISESPEFKKHLEWLAESRKY